jgi:steroid 5-alpha reductase family enzyme
MLFWWSTYFAALPALLQLAPAGSTMLQRALPVTLGAISPMFVTYLLMNISGIPIHERNQKKKHGSNPAYQEYVKKTNLLLPFPKF